MKIIVLGASGKTGREVVAQAVAAGHTVTAFVRDPAKLGRKDVAVAVGDARSADDLKKALAGQDGVISTLGTNRGDDNKLIESSTQALLEAMRATGVTRLVMLSTFAASPTFEGRGLMKIVRLGMKGIVEDKTAGETLLKGSDVDWTIVYASRLTDGPKTGGYRVVDGKVTSIGSISRADLADALISTLSDATSVHQSRVLNSQ